MRLSTLMAGALLLAPLLADAGELLRIYALAQRNDATLQAAEYARRAAVEARPQALAALLPQIYGSAAQNWQRSSTDGVDYIDSARPELGTQRVRSTSTTQPYSYGLSLSQPLFDWSALRRYTQAGDRVALAETSWRAQQQDLILRVAQRYFDVLAAADALRSLDAQYEAVSRQRDEARRRLEVGVAAITDVQEAQASADLVAAQRIEAQQTLDAAREALAEITGEPVLQWVPLQDDIPLPTPAEDAAAWVRAALNGNFELMIAQYNAAIAAADVGIARAGHYPTLGLGATKTIRDEQDTFADRQNTGAVALQLSVPLFAGGAVASQVREAVATREQYQAQLLGQQRLVERQTRNAYQGVLTGSAKVRAYKQAVLSNTTALEASRAGMRVGTRTTIDVLNSQQLLYSAQRDYLRSRYDYLMSFLQLKAAAGQLKTEDLRPIDALLAGG